MEMIFSFGFFVLFFFAMSVGFLVKGKPIKGSCGGVAALMGNESCEICGGDPNKCDEVQQSENSNDLAYDASAKKK